MTLSPTFDTSFIDTLDTLFAWRRDVRRFQTTPVPEALLDEILDVAQIAPSVGNSQPWRWVSVESEQARAAVRANFNKANAEALGHYADEEASAYARLKLAGLDAAPTQFAVFTDYGTLQGKKLGRLTMPETLDYSTVGCIMTFWLAARARGIGMGWLSILDPEAIKTILKIPQDWHFVGYLCVGLPQEEHEDPELVRHGWQDRTGLGRKITVR